MRVISISMSCCIQYTWSQAEWEPEEFSGFNSCRQNKFPESSLSFTIFMLCQDAFSPGSTAKKHSGRFCVNTVVQIHYFSLLLFTCNSSVQQGLTYYFYYHSLFIFYSRWKYTHLFYIKHDCCIINRGHIKHGVVNDNHFSSWGWSERNISSIKIISLLGSNWHHLTAWK